MVDMFEKSEWEFCKKVGEATLVYRIVLVKMYMGQLEYWSYQTTLSLVSVNEQENLQIRNFA